MPVKMQTQMQAAERGVVLSQCSSSVSSASSGSGSGSGSAAAAAAAAVDEGVDEVHLDWSSKQGRILTFAGRAEEFYKADMFAVEELPHYELDRGTAQRSFLRWQEAAARGEALSAREAGIVGCWSRPLFLGRGGFENTTDATEEVFNMQAPGLFIDLRIPVRRARLVDPSRIKAGMADLSDTEIRYLARQHVFGGFSRIVQGVAGKPAPNAEQPQCVCVRHHFIDWNYIGHPRTRPNKWSIEHPPQRGGASRNPGDIVEPGRVWMEHSYAPHPRTGQPYYSERWARRTHDSQGSGRIVSLLSRNSANDGPKAIIIVIGQRFSYLVQPSDRGLKNGAGKAGQSLPGAVDCLLQRGERSLAEELLQVHGGHGIVTENSPWIVSHSTQPWQEGKALFEPGALHVMQDSSTASGFKVVGTLLDVQIDFDVVDHENVDFDGLRRLVAQDDFNQKLHSRL